VSTAEVFDTTVTERRPGRQPVSERGLIDQVDAVWQALERLGDQTMRGVEGASVAEEG
jgi:hypothetical protein